MTDELLTTNQVAKPKARYNALRPILAVLYAWLAYHGIGEAMANGIGSVYGYKLGEAGWTAIGLWDDHWFIRLLAEPVIAIWSGFFAGVVLRKDSRIVRWICITPFMLNWVVIIYFGILHFTGDSRLKDFSAATALLPIASLAILPLVFFNMFKLGAEYGAAHGSHFDERRLTFLGVKFYNCLWAYPMFNLTFLNTAWLTVIVLQFVWVKVIAFTWWSFFFGSLVGSTVVSCLIFGIGAMADSFTKGYELLAGLQQSPTPKKEIFKLLFLVPFLAMIVESVAGFFILGWTK